ncbi:hypothetical protein GCM10023220_45840 [Streptomyces ziwulingensis]|uniref:Uncharacterized protein n=1 Tax=Streptomyces ziwulingensis TaxID=1045501 RepID=A0ABP9CG94_9ACTN
MTDAVPGTRTVPPREPVNGRPLKAVVSVPPPDRRPPLGVRGSHATNAVPRTAPDRPAADRGPVGRATPTRTSGILDAR